jgi:hypothetical protein
MAGGTPGGAGTGAGAGSGSSGKGGGGRVAGIGFGLGLGGRGHGRPGYGGDRRAGKISESNRSHSSKIKSLDVTRAMVNDKNKNAFGGKIGATYDESVVNPSRKKAKEE